MLLLCALIVGSGSAWATDETIEITYSNFSNTSYNTSESTFLQSNITFGYVNAMRNGSNGTPTGWAKDQVIQTKNGGSIYNKTAISGLKNIRVYIVANTNSFTVTSGTSAQPTDNSVTRPNTATGTESITYSSYANKTVTPNQTTTASYYDFTVNNDYFKIAPGGSLYIWKIVLTYSTTHTLTYSATNGSIGGVVYGTSTAVASGASVAEGGKVTLTAQPADGYEFSSWEVSGTGSLLSSTTTNPTTFTMGTANATVTANFVASGATPTYALTITPPTGGTITVLDEEANDVSSGDRFEEGTELTIEATASTGYTFTEWTGTTSAYASTSNANTTFTMPASAATIAATFTLNTHTLNLSSDHGTCVTTVNGEEWDGSSKIPYGAAVVVTATPSSGYLFSEWVCTYNTVTINGNEISFTMPDEDVELEANYSVIITHTAQFSVNGNIDENNNCTVAEGEAITFPANPEAIDGKSFVGWTTSALSVATNTAPTPLVTSATMGTSDITYYAVFADVEGSTASSWTATDLGSLTSTDIFVIVGTTVYDDETLNIAMPTTDATGSSPAVKTDYEVTIANGKIDETENSVADALKWNISGNATDGYTFYPNGSTDKFLYCLNDNKGVRVGTPSSSVTEDHTFTLTNGYLTASFTSNTRYIGIYDYQDWRCYTSYDGTSNIAGQSFAFYKYIAATATYSNYCTTVVNLSASDLAISSSSPVALEITTANISPTSTITWTTSSTGAMSFVSNDESVATVSSAGVITAVGEGTAKITVSQDADENYKASSSFEVIVNVTDNRSVCATGIDLPTAQKTLTKGDLANFAATSTPAAGFTGTINYTYETSDADIVAVATGTYSAEAFGTADITITATPTGGNAANYKPASQVVTVTVIGTNSISLDPTSKTVTFSANTFDIAATVPTDNYNGSISAVSDNEVVAEVDVDGTTITVYPHAVGSVKITVTAGTDTYYPTTASAECNLTFTAPEGSATAPNSEVVVFNETFDKCNGAGGNDGSWNSVNPSAISSSDYDGLEWTTTNIYASNKCVKGGTGSAAGSATTPNLTLEDNVSYTLTFKAAAWNTTEEGTTLKLSATNAYFYVFDETENDYFYENEVSVTLVKGAWTSYTLTVVADDASQNANITFSSPTAKGKERFFLDDVKLTKNNPPTATVTLNKFGYATYCSPYPIDFSSTTGYTAWRVSSVASNGTITFAKITEKIKGGQGVLLYNQDADGVNSTDVTINFADGTKEFSASENLFEGTLAPTYVAANEYYGLSGESFVKVSAGTVPAGKALLPASVVPPISNTSRLTFVFEDVQGIKTIEHSPLTVEDGVYNLQGQRVDSPKKGLYIVNGKKVMVK